MRLSVVLLLLSLAGVLGGAALIGVAALGAAVIFDSLCVGVYALARETGDGPQVREVAPSLGNILERARRAA